MNHDKATLLPSNAGLAQLVRASVS